MVLVYGGRTETEDEVSRLKIGGESERGFSPVWAVGGSVGILCAPITVVGADVIL